jgi:hypothetical protein
VIDNAIADELVALAQAIARMNPPSNHNPHAFHEDRSELASRARSIAVRLRSDPAPKPVTCEIAQSRKTGIANGHQVRHIDGRTVLVLTRRPELMASDNRP